MIPDDGGGAQSCAAQQIKVQVHCPVRIAVKCL